MGSNMLCNALFVLVSMIFRLLVVLCWRRHNSRRCRNHRLVYPRSLLLLFPFLTDADVSNPDDASPDEVLMCIAWIVRAS